MIICRNCGTQNPKIPFCKVCGGNLNEIMREELKEMINGAIYNGDDKEVIRLRKIAELNNINLKRDENDV